MHAWKKKVCEGTIRGVAETRIGRRMKSVLMGCVCLRMGVLDGSGA